MFRLQSINFQIGGKGWWRRSDIIDSEFIAQKNVQQIVAPNIHFTAAVDGSLVHFHLSAYKTPLNLVFEYCVLQIHRYLQNNYFQYGTAMKLSFKMLKIHYFITSLLLLNACSSPS